MKTAAGALAFVYCLTLCGTARADSCDAIVVHGLRNISISQGADASIATNYFNHCQKNFQSMTDQQMANAEVEIFGYGKGGGNYSRAQREESLQNWCTTNSSIAVQNRSAYQESQTFYQGAISAWESCKRLDSKDISINPLITADNRTVDIGLVYRGNTHSGIMFYGVPTEGFTCRVNTPISRKEVKFPIEVGNETIQVHCERDKPHGVTIQGADYSVLGRGTISIQTASDPFQLFFAPESDPPAPLQALAKLQRDVEQAAIPVGTIIMSALPPNQFTSPANPQYAPERWVEANGKPLPAGSLYEKLTGLKDAPDVAVFRDALYLQQIVASERKQGENVREFQKPGLEWTWIASVHDIMGKRYNNDYEQDVNQFQVWIDNNGITTAQGRTYNWKFDRWGPWQAGIANVLGLGYARNKAVYYYVKIN